MPATSAAPLCSWLLAACTATTINSSFSAKTKPCRRIGRTRCRVQNNRPTFCRVTPQQLSLARQGDGASTPGESSRSLLLRAGRVAGGQTSQVFGDSRLAACVPLAPIPRAGGGRQAITAAHAESENGQKRRVVVTGLGVVSCFGNDVDTFYNSLLEGKSGVTTIENFDASAFPTQFAGEIKNFDWTGYVHPKMAKRMDQYIRYLITAGKKALEEGGITEEVYNSFDKTRCGVLIGSAMGGMQVFNDAVEALRNSYRKMNPFCIPFVTTNMGSALLAMDLGFMGPNYSISTACATGNYCILSAANHIIKGEADLMLSGGADAAVLPIGLGGFVACKALSKRNDAPEKASRPWDTKRDGFVMGEGAGVLVLEELEHAKRRGAKIYAEFLGGSFTCDAHHMTEPHPEGRGVSLCIERALETSGVRREDVNYVNAHATSTLAGDLQEYKAISKAFGGNSDLRMNSTKSMIGHLLGAAGAIEAVATVQAIATGWVHPTINIEDPEPSVDMTLIPTEKVQHDINVALSNSFGFGGHNSCILFGPYKQ